MLRDLVDRHLLGTLTEAEKLSLKEMMESDTRIAEYVRESEEAFALVQHARLRRLRNRLKDWDRSEDKNRGNTGGGMTGFLLVLLSFILFFGWLGHHYSPGAMAARSFERTVDILPQPEEGEGAWKDGNLAFREHAFPKAILLYQPMLQSENEILSKHAQWKILLCQFAIAGPTPAWQESIQRFSVESPSVYKKEVHQLIRTLHSPTYILLYRNVFGQAVAAVKPKII
jgi:hypothetical protein